MNRANALGDRMTTRLAALALILLTFASPCVPALAADPPKPGQTLPPLAMSAPLKAEDRAYLGIGDAASFKLSDVKAGFVLFEVLGVYCPQCHVQAPHFDKLFARIKADPELSGKVKMLGMAAGATKEEVEYLLESGAYKFPVAYDTEFAAHKLLGEPKTPYTMLVNAKGQVLYAHLGIVEDVNALFEQIAKLAR
jgi:hypothetical protein